MPRYKDANYDQTKMIPISFDQQILPGSFEHSLCYLIEEELDLSVFDQQYGNDEGGRPAYDPAILLKIVLLAYSRGITSSRKIEQLCRENVTFMAVSADSRPHFTTLADFVSRSPDLIADIFKQVVLICDDLGLIGKEMFAIDGCKLPSNASKEWSGTKADLKKKQRKIDRAVCRILQKHRDTDQKQREPDVIERERQQVEKLRAASRKIKTFLAENDDRKGVAGRTIQSNITDNESAKMKTSHGVIQGYTGVAAADSKHQVVVHAEAFGQGQEHGLLKPMVEGIRETLEDDKKLKKTKVTADSGYCNEDTLKYLAEEGIDGYLADTGFRARDPRFMDYKHHKPKTRLRPRERFTQKDFQYDVKKRTCLCPAGKAMWLKADEAKIGHYLFMQFQAYETDCTGCTLRKRCLKRETQKTPRQINIKLGASGERKAGLYEKMKRKIDSERGRHIYSQRLGTVEPVFGNITHAIGIKRFSLRGKQKVDGQWKLMTMLHNIFKIHRYGWEW